MRWFHRTKPTRAVVDVDDYVDVDVPARRRAIAEAEYQQELDRQTCVLRVSGGAGARQRRKVTAIVEWVRRDAT